MWCNTWNNSFTLFKEYILEDWAGLPQTNIVSLLPWYILSNCTKRKLKFLCSIRTLTWYPMYSKATYSVDWLPCIWHDPLQCEPTCKSTLRHVHHEDLSLYFPVRSFSTFLKWVYIISDFTVICNEDLLSIAYINIQVWWEEIHKRGGGFRGENEEEEETPQEDQILPLCEVGNST